MSILGKDILGIAKFLETSQRFPLLTFCHKITIPLPFCYDDGLLLLPGTDDGGWGVSNCNSGVGGLGVSSEPSILPSLSPPLLTSV